MEKDQASFLLKKGHKRDCLFDKVIIAILYRFEMEFINNSSSNLQFGITQISNYISIIKFGEKIPLFIHIPFHFD